MTRVAITGAAGLVGQNLICQLESQSGLSILAIDKHATNTQVLRELHPSIDVVEADLAEPGGWQSAIKDCDALVLLHAQIGGLVEEEFRRNNLVATSLVLDAVAGGRCKYLCHVSSSVVNSMARDFYTESKKEQEALVSRCALRKAILRPTLMFGWFDRKHLGWLRQFMRRSPVFPVPGHGRYTRQPLFAGDFAQIIARCLEDEIEGTYDISGLERIDYIDLIRLLKESTGAPARIVRVPYGLFWCLLRVYSFVDRDPPFTTKQLEALVTPDLFDEVDWPGTFGVKKTSLREALDITFNHPVYSHVELKF